MTKTLFLIALFFCFIATDLSAQTNNPKAVIKQAKGDVRRFRLNRADYRKFMKDRRNVNSDYFKPLKSMVRDTTLLSDSTYIKAFRSTAYRKTRSRQLNTHIYIVGGVVFSVTAVTVIMISNMFGGVK